MCIHCNFSLRGIKVYHITKAMFGNIAVGIFIEQAKQSRLGRCTAMSFNHYRAASPAAFVVCHS